MMTDTHALAAVDNTIPVLDRWIGSWQISIRRQALSVVELTDRYDESASTWARTLTRLGFPDAYESMLRDLGIGSRVDFPSRVLDCGIGTGALSQALANVHPTTFTLDAVDVSPQMLKQAEQTLNPLNIDATLRVADACTLPYPDNAFDLVMTAHMLEHLPDPVVALKEMVRVLRPGGILVACITRRSILGSLIHLKWRTHRLTHDQASQLLHDSGLRALRQIPFNKAPICRHLSRAYAGRKAFDTGITTNR